MTFSATENKVKPFDHYGPNVKNREYRPEPVPTGSVYRHRLPLCLKASWSMPWENIDVRHSAWKRVIMRAKKIQRRNLEERNVQRLIASHTQNDTNTFSSVLALLFITKREAQVPRWDSLRRMLAAHCLIWYSPSYIIYTISVEINAIVTNHF